MLAEAVSVLDHGFVRYIDHMGSDLSVVRAARVSYDAAWRAGEDEGSDAKLIRYLWKNHHTTPFEAGEVAFEVMAPIFVLRQWHRHRTQSYNELSARYKELPEIFYVPKPEAIGVQSASSKQARDLSTEPLTHEERGRLLSEIELTRMQNANAFELYRGLIARGWPRELARSVLPVATYSHMFVKMNLLNFMKFLMLRCHSHAQYEIRVYAEAMRDIMKPYFPVCLQTWEDSQKASK